MWVIRFSSYFVVIRRGPIVAFGALINWGYRSRANGKSRIFHAETYRSLRLFRSSPVSRAGIHPVQRLITVTERLRVSYTRGYKQSGKASLSFIRVYICMDLKMPLWISCKNLSEGLSPSYLKFPVVLNGQKNLLRLYETRENIPWQR